VDLLAFTLASGVPPHSLGSNAHAEEDRGERVVVGTLLAWSPVQEALMTRARRGVVVALFVWCLGAAALDGWGHREPEGPWDAIVVAGCRVMPDGAPSPALARRVDRAVALWRGGAAPVLVFTGGVGDHGPAEGEVAAAYARAAGVPDGAILVEAASTSTEENAAGAAELLSAQRVVVVTDTYHVFRARRVFARYFAEVDGVGSTPEPWPRVRGALREVVAVLAYGLMGRLR
jgi:uncharacterized SAM-binding protein YcdF (DUF218 family)